LSGEQLLAFQAGRKAISACAVSPDGEHLLSGCLDGFLIRWQAQSQRKVSGFVAHGRPISAITFAGDGATLATASWDRNVILWGSASETEGRMLSGHEDIVAGCRFTPDSRSLLSWSYDGTLVLWDVASARRLVKFTGHGDRVTAAAISPDGCWAASGARDATLKLWNLREKQEVTSMTLKAEVRACAFLLDGTLLVAVDSGGRLSAHSLPDLEERLEATTDLHVQCAQLAPAGNFLALGCEDGKVRMVALDGFDSVPLVVTPRQTSRRTATAWQRFFGKSTLVNTYQCTCPVCRQSFELPSNESSAPLPCPHCSRSLRISN
jgi:WD40 repeat protein